MSVTTAAPPRPSPRPGGAGKSGGPDGSGRSGGPWAGLLGRLVAGAGLLSVIALLPWISGSDAALTVLRARSGEGDPTPEAIAAVREQLGLDSGPLAALGH